MSRLSNLLRQVDTQDPQLAADLKREMEALAGRRAFGLNFERHIPEAVDLPGRAVRRGDKVRFLPERGEKPSSVDRRLWRVGRIRRTGEGRVADLARQQAPEAEQQTARRAVDDLAVVAEFRDPIYPGLVSTGKVERGGDRPFHSVINAENFHALQVLLYTHEGKVDAIYIDPPYNTGARDWKYNNYYVDSDDAYRHSKWLAMMERRLKLATRLLNPEGSVLIVTIDENEVHRLSLLLKELFPSSKIQMVTALINPAGASIIDQFARVDEHLLFVHIGSARPQRTIAETTPLGSEGSTRANVWESLQRSGGNSRRQDTKAKFFPIYIDEKNRRIVGCGDHLPEGKSRRGAPGPPHGCVQQWPIKTDGSEACLAALCPNVSELSQGRADTPWTKEKRWRQRDLVPNVWTHESNRRWGVGSQGPGRKRCLDCRALGKEGSNTRRQDYVDKRPLQRDRARLHPLATIYSEAKISVSEVAVRGRGRPPILRGPQAKRPYC